MIFTTNPQVVQLASAAPRILTMPNEATDLTRKGKILGILGNIKRRVKEVDGKDGKDGKSERSRGWDDVRM